MLNLMWLRSVSAEEMSREMKVAAVELPMALASLGRFTKIESIKMARLAFFLLITTYSQICIGSVCLELEKKMSQYDGLGIGDLVSLRLENDLIQAFYVGAASNGRHEESAYFIETSSGRIIAINREDTNFVSSHPREFEKNLEIKKQEAQNCAVHSTVNCLRQLDSIGKLTNATISSAVQHNLDLVFRQLSILEASNVERLLVQQGRSTRNVGYSQFLLRKQVLLQNGLVVESLTELRTKHSQNLFLKSLKEGLPVILEVDVRLSDTKFERYENGRLVESSLQWLVPAKSMDPNSLGGHSVLAVGYIQKRPAGWFRSEEGYVIVLDSSTGSFALWGLKDLRKFTRFATIVR